MEKVLKSLTRRELIILSVVATVEFIIPLLLGTDLYDIGYKEIRLLLILSNIILGIGLYWIFLKLFKVPSLLRLPGALWGLFSWYTLFLSHTAYLGYFLIPIEILISTTALSLRTDLKKSHSFLTAFLVRILLLIVSLYSRQLLIQWKTLN